jgi:hypothetical protein
VSTQDQLAAHRACVSRIAAAWDEFQTRRSQRLRERERFGHAAEQATESILEDLFTLVLDWTVGDLNHQVGRADLTLTRLGIKYLIVEAKRPGALAWDPLARERALQQARRYADQQRVQRIAVSDGILIHAADIADGGLRHRVSCRLEHPEPQETLWWLSVHGIYRETPDLAIADDDLPIATSSSGAENPPPADTEELLHHKYKLPCSCFAYVGDASDAHTWKLPYLHADGTVDTGRLSGAIRSILSNYRGAQVTSIPESAIPEVLVRLGRAAHAIGKLDPAANGTTTYAQLTAALSQLGRLDEVTSLR